MGEERDGGSGMRELERGKERKRERGIRSRERTVRGYGGGSHPFIQELDI